MANTTALGPWPQGIDNVSGRGATLQGRELGQALVDAVNVDIDRAGRAIRRRGAQRVDPRGMHSLRTTNRGVFAMMGQYLHRLGGDTWVQLADMDAAATCDYAVIHDFVVASNGHRIVKITGAGALPLSVTTPSAPTVGTSALGGLLPGRYSVAIAGLRAGEESGLSTMRTVTVPDGGGITLTAQVPPGADGIRVYRTSAGGEVLYRHEDLPADVTDYILGNVDLGAEAGVRNLRPMPAGDHVAAWNGRLLTAQGRHLYVGEPMRYGLYSPIGGIVQLPERITFLAPTQGCLYVGQRHTTYVLRGPTPKDWVLSDTHTPPPFPRSATRLNAGEHALEVQSAVVWLTEAGYAVGTEDGMVLLPQANRLRISAEHHTAASCTSSRRITTALF
jgi:hypothetical protein